MLCEVNQLFYNKVRSGYIITTITHKNRKKERIDFKKGNISFYPASGQWFVYGIVFSLYKVVRAGVPRFPVLRLESQEKITDSHFWIF